MKPIYLITAFFTLFLCYSNEVLASNISTCINNIKRSIGHYEYVDRNRGGKFSWCEGTAPFVHVVIAKINDSRNTIGLVTGPEVKIPSYPTVKTGVFELKTLKEHADSVGAWAAINGFMWNGTKGTRLDTDRQGVFKQTHYLRGRLVRAPQKQQAEVSFGFSKKSLYGVNLARYFRKPANSYLQYSPFNYDLLSSNSSVIKTTVNSSGKISVECTTGPTNRWSAIGVRSTSSKQQYLVMLSTVKGKNANPLELCEVFKALGVPNAIRADGGSAAGIYFNGKHLNPLTGLDRAVFGDGRKILYGLYVK